MEMRSTEINEIAAALCKAQTEMPIAGLNKINPFFKSRYADFQAIVEASRPTLTKNGLSVVQQIVQSEEGSAFLITMLMHISGQWIGSRVKISPSKNDIQSMSSYNTYLKRISYSSLIGVVTGDEDDDGEAAMPRNNGDVRTVLVSTDQLEQLEQELIGHPDITRMVLQALKIESLSQMPRERFSAALNRIQAIKRDKVTN